MNLTIPFTSSQYFEVVNGVLLVIYIGMVLRFSFYIFGKVRRLGLTRHCYDVCAGAIAITVFLSGGLMIRGATWTVRHLVNSGNPPLPDAITLFYAVATVGLCVQIIGGNCILWAFAPETYGLWPAIVLSAIALAFGFGMAS